MRTLRKPRPAGAARTILTGLIAAVWLVNGFFCKVLDLAPRHQEIVARILGREHAGLLTRLIGLSEIVMCLWVLSGIKPHLNAATQILIVAAMNVLEFLLAPDLLLWGRMNAVFALMFILVISYNEFVLKKQTEPSLYNEAVF